MTAQIAPAIVFQAFTPNGEFLAAGKLFTYVAGTSTPQVTYVDSTQTTPNANPVILNASGQANVWLDPALSYKFVLQDQFGNLVPPGTVDHINGSLSPTSLTIGTPPNGTTALTVNGNTTDAAVVINAPIISGAAVKVIGNVNQALILSVSNPNTGTSAASQLRFDDGTNFSGLAFQNPNTTSNITNGANGSALSLGTNFAAPVQIFTNGTLRATISAAGNVTLSGNIIVNGASTLTGGISAGSTLTTAGPIGINGASPPAQLTGWGTPTGNSVANNFNGATATLPQATAVIAQLITSMKALGLFGT